MGRFDVWAPLATSVTLRVREAEPGSAAAPESPAEFTVSLEHGADCWWRVPDSESRLEPQKTYDYGYLLDQAGDADDPPRKDGAADDVVADPRSRRQPAGVHGWSRTVDPAAFDWHDSSWTGRQLAGAMIYELHIGTFTPEGTFDAAIGKLEHLISLGVGFVELLPVNAFNGTHNWGYDGVLWYAIHEAYGGPAGYQRFVDACHARGLGVIQDVVYNHLGPSGNVLPRFGPYLTTGSRNTWGETLNLDGEGSGEVRAYILDNVAMWFTDYHVDGLRLDAVHALRDSSNTHILKQIATDVEALSTFLGRPLTLIAESDLNDPVMFTPREAGGYGLTAQWSDDFHHALHANLTGEDGGYYTDFASLSALAKVICSGFFHDGTYSSFRRKFHGRLVDTTNSATWHLIVSSQNHDQIGNRATGDRLTAQLDSGQLAIAAVLTMLGPFTPMLFMGEEWGASSPWQFFTSHPEPDLGNATAKGRIEEFAELGWNPGDVPHPQDLETFERSKLDWAEPAASDGKPSAHSLLLDLYRELGRLRRTVPEFTDPRFNRLVVAFDEDRRWLSVRRQDVVILVNFGDNALGLPVGSEAVGEIILSTTAILGDASTPSSDESHGEPPTRLAAHAALVFRASELKPGSEPASARPREP